MKFGTSHKIKLCNDAALGLLIVISVVMFASLGIICGGAGVAVGQLVVIRIVAYICLPIMMHRLVETDAVIVNDMSMLKSYSAFGADCGDQLAKLDVVELQNGLAEADRLLISSMTFVGIMIAYYILEIIVLIGVSVPCVRVTAETIAYNWKVFFGCTEFAQYMKVSFVNS